jgi:predicted nucleic acid-binding Zn ribbon protein
VGEDLDAVLRRAGGAAGLAAAAVFARWEEAVGPAVAVHARPLRLDGTTLVIGVDAPGYATQLRLLSGQLLARLRDLVGPGAVDSVDVRVRP